MMKLAYRAEVVVMIAGSLIVAILSVIHGMGGL